MAVIHPSSVVDPRAELAEDVEVGPFCLVGPRARLGRGNRLLSHVVIDGNTTIGEGNVFHPHAVIGGPPQDLKYRGAETRLEIGSNNQIREAVTIHTGTEKGGGVTRLGDNNLLMVNAHIGHDAQFGSRCIIGNNVMIAGHVVCGNNVVMNGAAGVHHFVTIGDFAYVAGAARIHHDIPPFVKVTGDDEIRALNKVGLKRAGVSDEEIEVLDEACRRLFFCREGTFAEAMAGFDGANGLSAQVTQLLDFLRRRNLGKHGRYLESQR